MALSKTQVQHIAKLARLELTEEEAEKMKKDLSSILDYFEKLKEVDTKDVEPTFYSIPIKNIMREDKVDSSSQTEIESMLSQAPMRQGKFIKVKEILK